MKGKLLSTVGALATVVLFGTPVYAATQPANSPAQTPATTTANVLQTGNSAVDPNYAFKPVWDDEDE
ncbi:hypothetical protein [Alicyclobacillus dauci]|uniref:Uncharacterized protein n=1 Tax=Alicyclobacillus dauci TaxID=1475485 RepID=A0ABY6Z3L7_9BACL|nr:hypothetical protein [Alicyclobacillus dauci]WAH36884.1 hypothetical protein NZD86_22420 [Alicyclobacillus dauci]